LPFQNGQGDPDTRIGGTTDGLHGASLGDAPI
jgi:hypothetical protein